MRAMRALPIALLLVSGVAAAQPGTLAQIKERKTLKVGMHGGLMPFVAVGGDADELRKLAGEKVSQRKALDGQLVAGLDVELMAEAARALGVELDIVIV